MLPLDLRRPRLDACAALAQTVEREFGRLDGLLHCAAELGAPRHSNFTSRRRGYACCQVNLTAAWLVTRLPKLLKQSPDASIVFTTADVGCQGDRIGAPLWRRRLRLEGMMQISAEEPRLGLNLRVNSINLAAGHGAARQGPSGRRPEYPSATRGNCRVPILPLGPDIRLTGRGSARSVGTNHRLSPSNLEPIDVANRINNPKEISDDKTVHAQIAYARSALALLGAAAHAEGDPEDVTGHRQNARRRMARTAAAAGAIIQGKVGYKKTSRITLRPLPPSTAMSPLFGRFLLQSTRKEGVLARHGELVNYLNPKSL